MSNYRLENDELGTNLGLIFASILGQEAPIGPGKKEQNKASKKEKATKKGGKEESKADTSPLQGKKKKKKESHAGSSATSTKKQPGVSYDKPVDDATIDYGVGSRSTPSGPAAHERFYVTTAINYTNGHPHMGHAYEAVTTDVLARFHRLEGKQVFFLTGTDEHGQKIASTAEGLGITPIQLCDKYVDCFKALNQRLKISNDNYVRTTDPAHEEVCRQLWRKCAEAGDIYLGKYEGWYNVKEETFVTDMEAEAAGFKDEHGLPLKRMSEESYFFRLSTYQERLVAHIEAHPEFVRPEMYRNNILNRLRDPKKPLGDLSISRTTFEWGVRVPEGFDQKHVMYVWFDALTNYLSGVRGLDPSAGTAAFWPASCHIIGKDIVWFHTVIWPCMLMSANVPLPTTVYSHGFINDKEGKKMSKSLGNVVDPHDELDKYPSDTFRWYLCREAPYGSELSFSEESLVLMHNSELADTLGNLAHRAFNLLKKYNDGVMPPPARDTGVPLPFDLGKVRAETCAAVASFQLQVACRCAIAGVQDVNKWITELEPWKMKGEGQAARRLEVVRLAAEALYAAAHLLGAFVPDAATALFAKIGHPPSALLALSPDFDNVPPGTQTAVGDILFAKLEVGGPAAAAAAATEERGAGKKKEGAGAGGGGKKKEQKKKAPAGGKGGATEPEAETEATSDFPLLEIRVGRITKVWEHPEAERLFCEEIDVGEAAGPRRIASGLREHYTLAEMEGRAVCVVCNLKPAKLAGFASAGMVLAACGADGKVELVDPPAGARPGDLITAEGHTGAFASAAAVKKKKIMEKVAAELATDAGRAACYRGAPLAAAPHGPLTCPTLAGAPIH